MVIKNDFSLQKLNTFGLNVTAKHFVELNSTDEVIEFFKSDRQNKERTLILGGGSNLLFTKDFDGIVIKINIEGIHVVKEDEHHFWVKAGAGVVWHDLVESCIKANFGGIENLSLIPGTVGAAPIQNIGAYGVEIKDTFEALEAINLGTGEKKYFKNQDCKFYSILFQCVPYHYILFVLSSIYKLIFERAFVYPNLLSSSRSLCLISFI